MMMRRFFIAICCEVAGYILHLKPGRLTSHGRRSNHRMGDRPLGLQDLPGSFFWGKGSKPQALRIKSASQVPQAVHLPATP